MKRTLTMVLRDLRDWAMLTRLQANILLGFALLGTLGIGTHLFVRGRVFEARLTVTAAASQQFNGFNPASVLPGLVPPSGFHSSPLILAQLMQLDGLLDEIGRAPVGTSQRSIGEALLDSDEPPTRQLLLSRLRRVLQIDVDRLSGLITVTVTHRDSAIVRATATELLHHTRLRFTTVLRSQAEEARVALKAHVDSAKRQLTIGEEAFRAFSSTSRSATGFSEANLRLGRLRREVELADAVYRQAVLDYESAVARELETAPALVVVDGSPNTLTRLRAGALRSLAIGFAASFGTLLVVLLLRRSLPEASQTRVAMRRIS
jgi:hypothetical protein